MTTKEKKKRDFFFFESRIEKEYDENVNTCGCKISNGNKRFDSNIDNGWLLHK